MTHSPSSKSPLRAWRGSLLHFLGDPGDNDTVASYAHFQDGLLVVEAGRVKALGNAAELLSTLPAGSEVYDHRGRLIMPGFIDVHTHFPQTDMVASSARQLLDWLDTYTFPEERKFSDFAHAREVADFYLDELLRNGTTTALVFGSVHRAAVDAFFESAQKRRLRMIAGKVLMDRNCPEFLRDTPESGYSDTADLIERWNGQDRLNVAITPRFAITSSENQLRLAGKLAADYPDVHIQSHLAENQNEVEWVRKLFPQHRSYLDVYDDFGLLRDRAIYAHCLHLDSTDRARMASSGAAAAFCPTSNLFLGSGLYDFAAADAAGMTTSVGTDIGGGTHFGMLPTLGAAYSVTQLGGFYLSSLRAFYLATLGNARALGLDQVIGNFKVGMEADFIILDPAATPLMARRSALTKGLREQLFLFMSFGDDRCLAQTCVMGEVVFSRDGTLRKPATEGLSIDKAGAARCDPRGS